MEPRDLQIAADFCKLVETTDLLEYLGLPKEASPDEALAALADRRKHMQAMQANPKFKDSARMLIKNYAALQRVMGDPKAHLEEVRKGQEAEKLPMLEMAIDSILADGVITPGEEAFVRESALSLGISRETYERVLHEKASARGVTPPQGAQRAGAPSSTPAPAWGGGRTVPAAALRSLTDADTSEVNTTKLRGAAGHGWWDATFTRMLLDLIPGGPGEMVDLYCRTALSATTLLPARRQLTWLGIDRSAERLAEAREQLGNLGERARLERGEPSSLPLADESVDFVIAIRALANLPDTVPVFAEAWRVMRPGGRIILAEPDGLAESFCFDGHLTAYNTAFHALCAKVDAITGAGAPEIGKPGLALGPKLTRRMVHTGLRPVATVVHASHNLKVRSWTSFARRLRGYPQAMARTVGLERSPELAAVHATVEELEQMFAPDHQGLGGHFLPLFVCMGVKD